MKNWPRLRATSPPFSRPISRRLALAALAMLALATPMRGDERADEFDRQIAPLLARRCLDCHNRSDRKGGLDLTRREAALQGGDSGIVVAAGAPEDSLLWEYVASDHMPPEHPLADDEKTLLRDWIAGGANWGSDPIDPFRFTTESRAGYDWWALQPLPDRVAVPEFENASGAGLRNPIDAFIAARLAASGLEASPQADRRTLIRRLSFDLLGLPPTPAAVKRFMDDVEPRAYERLVDRLLASPHYGERWARHWLDVIRFGESQGFERDKLRSNSWRYRDWVIDAFNRDLPYDEFTRRQLAGDVLYGDDASAVIATGMLVAGAYDEVGQNQQSAAMRSVVRQDELEDIVGTVGQTFLGLTVNCARCHDHKFDPVTQAEYYALTAALAGVWHGQRPARDESQSAARATKAAALAARIRHLRAQVAALEEPIRTRILADRQQSSEAAPVPQPVGLWEFDGDLSDAIGSLDATTQGDAYAADGRLLVDGKSFVATAPLEKALTEKTLAARVRLADLQQRGGAVVSLQRLDGSVFDAIVFGEQEPRRWMAGSDSFRRTQSFQATDETAAESEFVHVAIAWHADGTIAGYRNGQPYGQPYRASPPVSFEPGEAQLLFGLRHSPPGGNRFLTGAIDRAELYDRALDAAEVAAAAGVASNLVSERELTAQLAPEQRQWRDQRRFEIEQLESQHRRCLEEQVYAVAPRTPEIAHVLLRGNPATPGDVVAAGGVHAVRGVDADFGLPADAPDAERRAALAEWMTDRRNPLFARVIVNRLWHYHFGAGLVDTPNDFGFNGGRPTHRELLDWLAVELVRRDWSLKSIQRLIVTSATYRQSALSNEAAMKIDAGNRLLWRKSPRRLEAEVLRDTLLALADQLNGRLHGPGFHDFRTFSFNSQFYEMLDPAGATFHRRTIYRTWVRSGRSSLLDVFDCPDPSATAPRRAVTTTPLQALALLNNSFVLRMADQFAARAAAHAGDDHGSQIDFVYRAAFSRLPDEDERREALAFVDEHGLAAFCRVVFNSNELLLDY